MEQFKGALSSVEEALDSNKLTSGVQDQVAGLSEQVKGQLGELQGQLGDVVKGGLGELSSKLGEETSKALQPYQPLIQDLTGDLSVQLGSLKQATDNLLNAVTGKGCPNRVLTIIISPTPQSL